MGGTECYSFYACLKNTYNLITRVTLSALSALPQFDNKSNFTTVQTEEYTGEIQLCQLYNKE